MVASWCLRSWPTAASAWWPPSWVNWPRASGVSRWIWWSNGSKRAVGSAWAPWCRAWWAHRAPSLWRPCRMDWQDGISRCFFFKWWIWTCLCFVVFCCCCYQYCYQYCYSYHCNKNDTAVSGIMGWWDGGIRNAFFWHPACLWSLPGMPKHAETVKTRDIIVHEVIEGDSTWGCVFTCCSTSCVPGITAEGCDPQQLAVSHVCAWSQLVKLPGCCRWPSWL